MFRKLLLLSFIEGAAVMAAELGGARLLAPVFGSSLYTWATVMGVTLGALAGGYFFGGHLAELQQKIAARLRLVLTFAGIFLLCMPLIAHYLVPRISYLPFSPGVICSSLLLLLPPVFLLGASSPLFIQIQTNEGLHAGRVSGTVYAVSTAGGILSTFFCGFYMIPEWGLNTTLYSFGLLLFVSTAWIMGFRANLGFFLITLASYLNFQVFKLEAYGRSRDGILGRISVSEASHEQVPVRYLKINEIIQSEMFLNDRSSASFYVQMLDTLVPAAVSKGSNALVLGLGGGLTANLLQKKGYATDGVEFDKRIIEAARDYFFLSDDVNAIHDDARHFLNATKKKYKVVLVDIFKAEEQPSHVFTVESLTGLRNNLEPSGKLYITWHGYLKNEAGRGTRILLNTLSAAGYKWQIHAGSMDEQHRNLIILASASAIDEHRYLLNTATEQEHKLNTDNNPLLEKYNATANKAWRTNYLRYYQGL